VALVIDPQASATALALQVSPIDLQEVSLTDHQEVAFLSAPPLELLLQDKK